MYQELQDNISLFIKNYEIMKNFFKSKYLPLQISNAVQYTSINKEVDLESLFEAKNFLKNKANVFANFHGNLEISLINIISLKENYEEFYSHVVSVYNLMKTYKLGKTEYSAIAAIIIADNDYEHAEEHVKSLKDLYMLLKSNFKSSITTLHLPIAAILVLSGLEKEQLIQEIVMLYKDLKTKFKESEARCTMACVLSLAKKCPKEKINIINTIFDMLKQKKHKYSSSYELAVFAVLALLEDKEEDIVNDIIETDDQLIKIKGFGNWTLGYEERRKAATALVILTRLQKYGNKNISEDSSVEGSSNFDIISKRSLTVAILLITASCRK